MSVVTPTGVKQPDSVGQAPAADLGGWHLQGGCFIRSKVHQSRARGSASTFSSDFLNTHPLSTIRHGQERIRSNRPRPGGPEHRIHLRLLTLDHCTGHDGANIFEVKRLVHLCESRVIFDADYADSGIMMG